MTAQDQKPHTIITGAAGFIGFHLARHFQKAGYNPLCLDRQAAFPDGDIRNRRLSELKQAGCRVAFGDLAASDFVDATFAAEKPQLLLHMAARTNARGDDWAMYDRDNVSLFTTYYQPHTSMGCGTSFLLRLAPFTVGMRPPPSAKKCP